MCHYLQSYPASHSDTCRDRTRAELEKSEAGREYVARERARVNARKQTLFIKPQTCCVRGMVVAHQKNVTMRQDITATSGASSSSASRGPAMDIESQPPRKRVADVHQKTWKITSRWMHMKVQRTSHKRRRSLLMEECSLATWNTTSLKCTTSIWNKVAGE